MMLRQNILDQAGSAIHGDRDEKYGAPQDNFARIARLWSSYMGFGFAPHDVAAMMILVKIARIVHNGEIADNWIDIAGYAACGGEIAIDEG